MGSLGMMEMVLIFLVVLLVFGAKRIPEIARGIGQGINEFKSATNQISSEITKEDNPKQQFQRPPKRETAPREEQAPPEPVRADEPSKGDEKAAE